MNATQLPPNASRSLAGLTAISGGAGIPCGAIVMWSLAGDTTVTAISQALAAVGSKARHPSPVSIKVAAARACEAVAARHGLKLQPLTRPGAGAKQAKSTRSRATGGIALSRPLSVHADPIADLGKLEGPIVAMYRAPYVATRPVQKNQKIVQERYTVPASFDGEPAMVQELRDAMAVALQALIPADVSAWLRDRMASLGGLSLGGAYFLPADVMPSYEKIRQALEAARGYKLARIPAMRGDEAVDAIVMALENDTTAAIAAIGREIATGELGKRALATKEQELAGLLARLAKYEALLGKKLDDVRAKIDDATSAAAVAMLAASADDDLAAP